MRLNRRRLSYRRSQLSWPTKEFLEKDFLTRARTLASEAPDVVKSNIELNRCR